MFIEFRIYYGWILSVNINCGTISISCIIIPKSTVNEIIIVTRDVYCSTFFSTSIISKVTENDCIVYTYDENGNLVSYAYYSDETISEENLSTKAEFEYDSNKIWGIKGG